MATALSAGDTEQAEMDNEHRYSGGGRELVAALQRISTGAQKIIGISKETERIDYSSLSVEEIIGLIIEGAKKLNLHDKKTVTYFVKKQLYLMQRIGDFEAIEIEVYNYFQLERELLRRLPHLEKELLYEGMITQDELDEFNTSIKNNPSTIRDKLDYLLTLRHISNHLNSFPEDNSL